MTAYDAWKTTAPDDVAHPEYERFCDAIAKTDRQHRPRLRCEVDDGTLLIRVEMGEFNDAANAWVKGNAVAATLLDLAETIKRNV